MPPPIWSIHFSIFSKFGLLTFVCLSMLLLPSTAFAQNEQDDVFGNLNANSDQRQDNHVLVLFATDRKQATSKANDLSFRDQIVDDLDKITYGVFDEELSPHDLPNQAKNKKHKRSTLIVQSTAVPAAESDSSLQLSPERALSTRTLPADDVPALYQSMAKQNERGIVVFVHGCCTGFHKAVEQAALTGAWLQSPAIMYDWGTRFGGYAGDLQAADRTQERFNSFMQKLTKEVPSERITLIGFSLGSQLISDYCLQTPDSACKFKEIILARPDLDLVAFKSHVPHILSKTNRISLYVANNDIALHCSGGIRRIFSPSTPSRRLGVARDELGAIPHLTVFDVSQVDPLHSMPNQVMAELIGKDQLPQDSEKFKFTTQKDGVVDVTWR